MSLMTKSSSPFVSQPTKVVCNAADQNTAFTMYAKALGFVFTQRREEFTDYQTFLGRLFYAVDPAYDRAVRNRILVQRHLRITDSANFDDLRTAFLSPFGMGAHSTQSYSAGSSSVKQQRDPCHKWNRGTCAKSESECFFAHCCDRRACRGNHRRSDCLVRDGTGTTTSKPPRDAAPK